MELGNSSLKEWREDDKTHRECNECKLILSKCDDEDIWIIVLSIGRVNWFAGEVEKGWDPECSLCKKEGLDERSV